MNSRESKPSTDQAQEPPPEIVLHRCYRLGCWTYEIGSHEVPIRHGLYGCDVEAQIVASYVKASANGAVRVRIDLDY